MHALNPAPWVQNGSEVTITGSSFSGNRAGATGGAMRVQVRRPLPPCAGASNPSCCRLLMGYLRLSSSLHHPPTPAVLSSPLLSPQGNFLCTGCTFSKNSAPLGGAVDVQGATWAAFEQYTFVLNVGVRAGGEARVRHRGMRR